MYRARAASCEFVEEQPFRRHKRRRRRLQHYSGVWRSLLPGFPGVVDLLIIADEIEQRAAILSGACCVRPGEVWILKGAVAAPKAVGILRANLWHAERC